MQKFGILIDDIAETRANAIRVRVKKTGKYAWIPRRVAEFYPGRVYLPYDLAQKILKPKPATHKPRR